MFCGNALPTDSATFPRLGEFVARPMRARRCGRQAVNLRVTDAATQAMQSRANWRRRMDASGKPQTFVSRMPLASYAATRQVEKEHRCHAGLNEGSWYVPSLSARTTSPCASGTGWTGYTKLLCVPPSCASGSHQVRTKCQLAMPWAAIVLPLRRLYPQPPLPSGESQQNRTEQRERARPTRTRPATASSFSDSELVQRQRARPARASSSSENSRFRVSERFRLSGFFSPRSLSLSVDIERRFCKIILQRRLISA